MKPSVSDNLELNMGTFGSSFSNDDDYDDSLSYELHLNFRNVPANTNFFLSLISSSTLLVKC